MKRLGYWLMGVAACVAIIMGVPTLVRADPPPLGAPCSVGPCKVTGASVGVAIPLPLGSAKPKLTVAPLETPKPGHFAGKFELVPLFDKGHRPVIRNGHQYEAARNTISFMRPNGEVLTVFAGARTDGASIPAPLWPLMPPDGPYYEAAVVHDELFKTRGTMEMFGHVGRTRAAPYTRAEANEVLREAMVALGVPAWKRIVIYEGVQAGAVVAPGAWGS